MLETYADRPLTTQLAFKRDFVHSEIGARADLRMDKVTFRRNPHGGASARHWFKDPLRALPGRKNCSMLRMACKVFNVNIITWLPHVFKSDESASGVLKCPAGAHPTHSSGG